MNMTPGRPHGADLSINAEGEITMDETTKNAAEEQNPNQPAGMEAPAQPTAEAEPAKENPATGAADAKPKPENDKQTEQTPADAEPKKDEPPAGKPAGKPAEGAPAAPDPAAQLVVANQKLGDVTAKLLTSKAESQAAQMGVKPDRIKHAVRLAELNGIDPTADEADAKIKEKLQAVLTDMPEMLGGTGTGSPGAFRKPDNAPKDAFSRGFAQG